MENNTLLDTLYNIYEAEMVDEFVGAYNKAQRMLGKRFESVMIDLSENIKEMQAECKSGTTPISCALILCLPMSDPELNDKDTDTYIKACAVWMQLKKNYYERKN